MPPLPNLSGGGDSGAAAGGHDMAGMMSGLMPVKMGVDSIIKGAQMIVQSGAVPGSEQVCGQIVALATSLIPMAAQQAMHPGPVPPVASQGGPGAPPPAGGGGGV